MSIKGKIESLISAGNTTTGEADTDLTSVVQSLVDGYGQGGGDVTIESLSVTENGTYTAPTGKAYTPVTVAVPQPSGTKSVSITSNGTTTEDVENYADAEITVNVQNSYTASDEGKVVNNGALTSQTSATYTENDTYDTTLIDEVTINVTTVNNQDKTVVPSESVQSITADAGYTGLGEVTVDGIPTNYVGSAVPRKSSADLTASGATVNVPSGYYSESASKAVASGTEGTPTATKETVANHSVDITPSVTNVEGYIQGGTKTGTAVRVSASELVSGTKSITENGTEDVTNYASVNVNVPNSYSASDEGKVVDGGALVSQSSATYTTNDTYDTTLIDEVTVNVSGGGSSDFETGTLTGTGTALSSYITIPVSKQCSHFVIIPASAVDSWERNEVTGCYAHQSYYWCTSYNTNTKMTATIDTRNIYVRFRESQIQVLFATNGAYRPLKTIEYKWIAW